MKISYNWLKAYLACDLSPEAMAEAITSIGLEVDSVSVQEEIPGGLAGVVVAEVLTCEAHPDSDHLHITTVNDGSPEPVTVVCGAPNVAAGQKVLFARLGTVLPGDFKIKKSKIRGVESFGMICAEDELGIGSSHDGIMVLEPEAVVGTPAKEYLPSSRPTASTAPPISASPATCTPTSNPVISPASSASRPSRPLRKGRVNPCRWKSLTMRVLPGMSASRSRG